MYSYFIRKAYLFRANKLKQIFYPDYHFLFRTLLCLFEFGPQNPVNGFACVSILGVPSISCILSGSVRAVRLSALLVANVRRGLRSAWKIRRRRRGTHSRHAYHLWMLSLNPQQIRCFDLVCCFPNCLDIYTLGRCRNIRSMAMLLSPCGTSLGQ